MPSSGEALAESDESFQEPETEIERQIAAAWAASLGVRRVGLGDNFFELGGHSLIAMQVLGELKDVLGVELPVSLLYEAESLRDCAREAAELLAEAASARSA